MVDPSGFGFAVCAAFRVNARVSQRHSNPLEAHADLVLGTETGGARFTTGAYGFWSAHVRSLLVDAGITDPDGLVDTLLAPVSAEVYMHQRARGLASAQITDALSRVAHGVLSNA